jgi:aminopeptidase N
MHVPVRLGLVTKSGRALPLTLEGENAIGPEERVLELTEPEQRFTFVDVEEEPLLSVGRRLSAPAHFNTPMTAADRAALMSRDTDPFNRWEAGQALAIEALLEMAGTANSGIAPRPDPVYVDAIGEVLAHANDDNAFAAEMLVPPSEGELALKMSPADPVAIHEARTALIRGVAEKHREAFETLYRSLESHEPFTPDAASAGRRRLRNVCLRYVTAEDSDASAQTADAHYRSATNMTDMIAGLAALSRMDWPEREPAFAHFYERFASDPLVLDKWMGLQAGSSLPGTIAQVRALMKHPAFDVKNPNRVRALIGAFSGNHLRFHEADGSGYALVGETLRALDAINPQVAARMSAAFENWRRYDDARQRLMRAELESILKKSGLSTNLFEVATKLLG